MFCKLQIPEIDNDEPEEGDEREEIIAE